MTEPEHAALEHIRRVAESILEVSGKTVEPSPALIDAVQTVLAKPALLSVPYESQLGAGSEQFINDSGAAAGAMLVNAYLETSVTPNDFYTKAGQHADVSLTFQQMTTALNYYGVSVELRVSLKLGDLALILTSNRPTILQVEHAVLKDAGLTLETFTGLHYLVAVGLDVEQVYVHDPLRSDSSGQGLGIPWMVLYQAWSQVPSPRPALIPRLALLRRVRVTATSLNVRQGPDATAPIAGTVRNGDVFEIVRQKGDFGMIGDERWISTKYVQDL